MKPLDAAMAVLGPIIIGVVIALAFLMSTPRAYAGQSCAGVWVTASYYGKETCHGRPAGRGPGTCHTAAGVPFNGQQWLVAHRTVGFGTRVEFTYRGRSVVAPVEDRGPYVRGRDFDLSFVVAAKLGIVGSGVVKVCARVLD